MNRLTRERLLGFSCLVVFLLGASCENRGLEESKRIAFLKQLHLGIALAAKEKSATKLTSIDVMKMAESTATGNISSSGESFLEDIERGRVVVFSTSWTDVAEGTSDGPLLIWDCGTYSLRCGVDGSIERVDSEPGGSSRNLGAGDKS